MPAIKAIPITKTAVMGINNTNKNTPKCSSIVKREYLDEIESLIKCEFNIAHNLSEY